MPVYPIPSPLLPVAATSSQTAHFSAAEFFRDSPWLNVPPHRKADILMEPMYPRMGLLGGAQEGGGKVSKLAALAAARKKKEGEKTPSGASTPATTDTTPSGDSAPGTPPSTEPAKGTPLSLRERLAGNGKPQRSSEGVSTLRSLGKGPPLEKKPSPDLSKPAPTPAPEPETVVKEEPPIHAVQEEQPKSHIRAQPSSFASTIVGDNIRPRMTEPSHLHSNTVDLMRIYGQDHAEPFDFAGPSPDDVVTNAQSSAKGLTFRTKV